MNTSLPADLFSHAIALYKKGLTDNEVINRLKEKGAEENVLTEIIKKVKISRKRNSGFIFCGIGIFLLVTGCLLTLLLFNSGNIRFALYGLTLLGLGLTIKGLIDLLGW